MPPSYANGHVSAQVDAHEDRIQRLEDNMLDTKTDIAEIKVRLEVVDEMNGKLDKVLDVLAKQDDRLQSLEGTRKRSFKVLGWIGGLATTVVGAAVLAFFGLS